ncbi:DUF3122 domain-containing protein [Romeria aff. gracilis LEGE 07310]|uniref:DUF3122 domain-containing protein n=1 Tax=Vasconcelosia minhoensis LEGE 07310 TaxID=915328 RepID=A0A8J7DM96_9CYAN|nr:DUF3122 domain-containing protein [Romeria gracilis]MBE9076175.1 DUF3122 domain-containing protein [Romeria aff. gracilis LEGE 07310]
MAKLKGWIIVGSLALILWSIWPMAAMASIHTYHEQPGQTTLRSKQSLRDRADRAWQVILFKRYQQQEIEGLYLRLIGFPGLAELVPSSELVIATGSGTRWTAAPALDAQTSALPANAAQYDLQSAIAALQGDIPLQVYIPLANGRTAELVVPPFAVQEWRTLAAQTPAEN